MKVSTGGTDVALNPTFDITFTLTDPCDPPTTLDKPDIADQTYVITDTLEYEHPEWTIDPSYC